MLKTRTAVIAVVVSIGLAFTQQSDGMVILVGQADPGLTGFGTEPNILTLQQPGGETEEWGSVTWNGTTQVETGDVVNGSGKTKLQIITDLRAGGVTSSNFYMIFDAAESGGTKTLILKDFDLIFYDSDTTGNERFRLTYTAPSGGIELENVNTGLGNPDWIFQGIFSAAEATWFDTTTVGRVGMEITEANAITQTDGAPDTFTLSDAPAPSTLVGLVGLAGVFVVARVRRRVFRE